MKTYWMNLMSGMIYVYTDGKKPACAHLWKEVSVYDYNKALSMAWANRRNH